MNTSSVIFVGGFTLVFGFFATQSFKADARALRTADARTAQLQADLIASTGVNLAAYYMATPWGGGRTVTNRPVNGGSLSYTITTPYLGDANKALVSSVGQVGDVTVTKIGVLDKGVTSMVDGSSWSQWSVTKIFTQPYTLSDIVVE